MFKKKSGQHGGEKLRLFLVISLADVPPVECSGFLASPGGPKASDWQRTHTHT